MHAQACRRPTYDQAFRQHPRHAPSRAVASNQACVPSAQYSLALACRRAAVGVGADDHFTITSRRQPLGQHTRAAGPRRQRRCQAPASSHHHIAAGFVLAAGCRRFVGRKDAVLRGKGGAAVSHLQPAQAGSTRLSVRQRRCPAGATASAALRPPHPQRVALQPNIHHGMAKLMHLRDTG